MLLLFCPFLLAAQGPDAAMARRRESLDILLKVLPRSSTKITGRINALDKSWEDWVKRTGELPPDFEAMPSVPNLPDPLEGVSSPEQWAQRRKLIRAQFEQWIVGRMPPAPDNLRAVVTGTHREGDVTVRDVRLEFGPEHKATLRVQVMIPPGKGPFPVLMTNHPRTRPWVATAVRRGYIGLIYFAADPIYGSPDDSDAYIDIYPKYDFSCVARWAWAGMRAVDYLYSLPEVDKKKIAITGHSRNGKQALLAAAFDERIGAVIPSSGNTGECDPWRYTTDMFANETIEQITGSFPHWFHPRLRFFAGREDKLPVDQNMLMALVAPRGLLMYSAFSETQGNSFGFEQGYRSVKRVYSFLTAARQRGLVPARGRACNYGRGHRKFRGLPGWRVWPQAGGGVRALDERLHVRRLEGTHPGATQRAGGIGAQGGADSLGVGRGTCGTAVSRAGPGEGSRQDERWMAFRAV